MARKSSFSVAIEGFGVNPIAIEQQSPIACSKATWAAIRASPPHLCVGGYRRDRFLHLARGSNLQCFREGSGSQMA